MNYLFIIIIYYLLAVSAELKTLGLASQRDLSGKLKSDYENIVLVSSGKLKSENEKLVLVSSNDNAGNLKECDFQPNVKDNKIDPKLECCHESDGSIYISDPLKYKCKKCGERYESQKECNSHQKPEDDCSQKLKTCLEDDENYYSHLKELTFVGRKLTEMNSKLDKLSDIVYIGFQRIDNIIFIICVLIVATAISMLLTKLCLNFC